MRIEKLTEKRFQEYDQLVDRFGAYYNKRRWLDNFPGRVQIYLIFDKGENIIGGFHLFWQKLFRLKIYLNPPFTPAIGLFWEEKSLTRYSKNDFRKQIHKLVSNFIMIQKHSLAKLSLDRGCQDMQPYLWEGFKVDTCFTYQIDLQQDLDDIFKQMSGDRRKSLRKAEKDGIVTKPSTDLNEIMKLILKTFSRQKKRKNFKILKRILKNSLGTDFCFANVAYQNEKPIACCVIMHSDRRAFYHIGGYDHNFKHHGAGVSALWESMKQAKAAGIKTFDLDGSMIPAIEKYFRGFGGELIPYYKIRKSSYIVNLISAIIGKRLL